jgi:RNA recognition motif-containing protein
LNALTAFIWLFFSLTSQDNPSDKDINQGTLVVFNLDPSVSNEDLRQIFGAYGEVKEVIVLS